MFVQLKNIVLQYDNESLGPIAVDVEYNVILNDNSKLEGNMIIYKDSVGDIGSCELWKFNKYIFENIMKNL